MIKRCLGHIFAILMIGTIPVIAATSAATVTEAVNEVSHGSSQAADNTPAKVGTQLQDGEYLKTGVKSRAELQLANQTVTRLGANTIFNYSTANNEIDLQAGTVLFSKPKDASQMNIKTASVTAAVVGTTGFVQVHGKDTIFGLIEGHATLTVNGVSYTIGAGQILQLKAGAPPQIYSFNVPAMTKTSPLMTKFHSHLPNQLYIDKEIAEYDDLVARGFVQPQPPGQTFVLTDFTVAVPVESVVSSHDNAGNALNHFVNPPPPPPPVVIPSSG